MNMVVNKIMKPFISLTILFLFSFNVLAGQPEYYVDRERGFSLIVPENWSVERFSIGAAVLRIQTQSDDYIANCSFTIVPRYYFQNKTQEWLDKNVNPVPLTRADQEKTVQQLQKAGYDIVYYYYSSIQMIGGRKANTLFYTGSFYSLKKGADIYMDGFYTDYVRPKDQFGVTCLGGGLSLLNAHSSFEKFNLKFHEILSSIKFL